MVYKFLLFDLDNTLLDFEATEELALDELLKEQEVEGIEAYKAYYKPMNQSMWQDLEQGKIAKSELVNTRFAKLFSHFGREVDGKALAKAYQDHLSKQGQLYHGARELLVDLTDRGYKLYAATNGIAAIQKGRLKVSALEPFFQKIFISEEVGSQKPEVAFYHHIANSIPGFNKSQALMIGDSLSADIKGGNDFGIDTVWYNPKKNQKSSSVHPTYEVSSYQMLLDLL